MKRNLAILVSAGLILPILAFALDFKNPLKYGTFDELINAIINFIFGVSLIIVPLVIIIGAFYFITSMGEPEKIKTAKDLFTYAIIGFMIVLLAKGLVEMIKQVFKTS